MAECKHRKKWGERFLLSIPRDCSSQQSSLPPLFPMFTQVCKIVNIVLFHTMREGYGLPRPGLLGETSYCCGSTEKDYFILHAILTVFLASVARRSGGGRLSGVAD